MQLDVEKYKHLTKENELKEDKHRQEYRDSIAKYERELEDEMITKRELIKEIRI